MHVFLNAHIYFLLYSLSFFLILWQALTIFALNPTSSENRKAT